MVGLVSVGAGTDSGTGMVVVPLVVGVTDLQPHRPQVVMVPVTMQQII